MGRNTLYIISLIISFVFLCSSCCSIVQGRTQQVGISSNPSGAEVTIDGLNVITPATVSLDRKNSYNVRMEKEGYESGGATITRHTSTWLLGNIIFLWGAVVGLVIDFANGSAYKLKPENINVTLQKKGE